MPDENARPAASPKRFLVWRDPMNGPAPAGHLRFLRVVAGMTCTSRHPRRACPMCHACHRHSAINGGRSALCNDHTSSIAGGRRCVSSALRLLHAARNLRRRYCCPTALHVSLSQRIKPPAALPPRHIAQILAPTSSSTAKNLASTSLLSNVARRQQQL
jgi:hypothetical protein